VKELEIFETFAAPDKGDGNADDRDHRQGRAATRIAIELGQHDARDPDAAIELTCALDRVLPCHGVRDVQQIRGPHGGLDRLQFLHQLVVDMQPTRGVDDDRIEALGLGLGQGAGRARDRIHGLGRVHLDIRFLADNRQLLNRRRATHIGRHHQWVPALPSEPQPQLAARRRFARTLEAQQKDDTRCWRVFRQSALSLAKQRQQFVPDDLDDLLDRRQALEHRLVRRLVPNAIDERLDDLEVDVRLEQRQADFPQRGLYMLVGQAHLAPEGRECVLDPVAERIEHGRQGFL
jgi:hypothetical protein